MKRIIWLVMILFLVWTTYAWNNLVVDMSDNLRVYYIIQIDNKIFDTNIELVAKKYHLKTEWIQNTSLISLSYQPALITVWSGDFVKWLDSELIGMHSWDIKIVKVLSKDAYGEYNQELVYSTWIKLFTDVWIIPRVWKRYEWLWAKVIKIKGNIVTLDYNHALAGKMLIFAIKVVWIEKTSRIIKPEFNSWFNSDWLPTWIATLDQIKSVLSWIIVTWNISSDIILIDYCDIAYWFCKYYSTQSTSIKLSTKLNLQTTFKLYPQSWRNANSVSGALSAYCAGQQGHYFDYIDLLYNSSYVVSGTTDYISSTANMISQASNTLLLNKNKLYSCMNSLWAKNTIQSNINELNTIFHQNSKFLAGIPDTIILNIRTWFWVDTRWRLNYEDIINQLIE